MAYYDTTWGAAARRRPPARLMAMDPEHAERVARAILASLDNWMEQAEEIAGHAAPATGNAARALHLKRSMMQAKYSLGNLIGDAEP